MRILFDPNLNYQFQIMTATVEAVVEQLDLAPIILTERINPNMSRVVPIPDSEKGNWIFIHMVAFDFVNKQIFLDDFQQLRAMFKWY